MLIKHFFSCKLDIRFFYKIFRVFYFFATAKVIFTIEKKYFKPLLQKLSLMLQSCIYAYLTCDLLKTPAFFIFINQIWKVSAYVLKSLYVVIKDLFIFFFLAFQEKWRKDDFLASVIISRFINFVSFFFMSQIVFLLPITRFFSSAYL